MKCLRNATNSDTSTVVFHLFLFFFKKILFCLRQGGQIACTIESIECFGTKVQKNAGINAGISVHLYDGALGKAEFAAELPVPIKLCKPAP
jgi:hypothetical protein